MPGYAEHLLSEFREEATFRRRLIEERHLADLRSESRDSELRDRGQKIAAGVTTFGVVAASVTAVWSPTVGSVIAVSCVVPIVLAFLGRDTQPNKEQPTDETS